MSPTPEGLLVGRPSRPWTIGRRLGSGACGTVHELVPPPAGSKKSPPAPGAGYAIKLAPLPPPRASTKAGKKRKKTAEERNADLIKYEYLTLQNVGAELRGRVVPDIPFMGDPPAFGETADKQFRYLVMERMAAPLSEVVPILLASHGKARGGSASIPLGDVAAAMLDCLRALHERGLLFVDVKPENFMLSGAATPAAKSGSGRKKASSSTDLGKRVRLIDFGLVEPWNDVVQGGRREDEGGALVGTPAYASLHVSSGHTAALRDDLEALGYVVAELALTMLSSSGKGGSTGKRKKKEDDEDGVLPWSNAKSEDELYNIKRDEMDEGKRSKSKLFAGLKAAGADAVMGDYFAAVRGLKYSETPDYDSLRSCLKELAVTVDGKGVSAGARAASGAAPKKAAAKSPARRRSARRKQEDSDSEDDSVEVVDENVENGKARGERPSVSVGRARAARPTRNVRKAKKETREMGTQTSPEVIDLNSSDDDDDADTMDWEAVASDENAAPDDDGGARGRGVLKLVVVEGPHQGQEISFGGDLPDTVLVGRDPASRAAAKDAARFALPEDGSASAVHAKFVVGSKTKVRSVRVHDMSSANGTYVQGSGLPKGKSRQAFANDKIRVGESLLQIRKA